MKKLTTLFSGTAAGAVLSITASFGAVAAQAASPDTPSTASPGTHDCTPGPPLLAAPRLPLRNCFDPVRADARGGPRRVDPDLRR